MILHTSSISSFFAPSSVIIDLATDSPVFSWFSAIALAFAREGAQVVVNDIDEEKLKGIAERIAKDGGEILSFKADVSSASEVEAMVKAVIDRFKTIDILVNNAGILRSTRVEEIPEEEWELVMDVNLKGVFLCSKAVLPIMKEKKYGRIVNISSSAGRSASELGGAHYTASKAGVLGFTRHLAREMAPYGITANAVCPGLIVSSMIEKKEVADRLEYFRKQIPLGRLGKPEEEADLVLFLASDEASYITGATVDINGGSLMM